MPETEKQATNTYYFKSNNETCMFNKPGDKLLTYSRLIGFETSFLLKSFPNMTGIKFLKCSSFKSCDRFVISKNV